MLMITPIDSGNSVRTLKLEGKLLGPWVRELEAACEQGPTPPSRVRLDLEAVTYVDGAGLRLLDDLILRGVTIAACSGFVAELLDLEPP
jgi:anti-anti-sigma regulatory factor